MIMIASLLPSTRAPARAGNRARPRILAAVNAYRLDLAPLALAAILLGYAVQINDGFYTPAALACVIAAIVAVAASLSLDWTRDARLVPALLLAGIASNLLLLATSHVGLYLPQPRPADHPFLIGLFIAAAILVVQIARDRRRAWRVWFPLLLVTVAAMGVWMIKASPRPHIDVITVHQVAISALRAGQNPYATSFPNIYRDAENYAPELVQGNQVLFGLPYPPLSLLMAVPGKIWFGDMRYAELISLILGAGFIGFASRTIVAPLAAALLLLTPRSLFVLEQGWTEPFAICWLGATVFTALRAPRLLPWMLALLVSVKQHLVLAVPFALLLLPRPFGWRAAVRLLLPSLLVPIALALPFVIWNPTAFFRSVVWVQLVEPFRPESLSVLRVLLDQGVPLDRDHALVAVLPLLALALSLATAWRRAPRTAAGFATGLGFALLLVTVTSKKAFCNYYFLVIATFCAAIAAGSAEAPQPQTRDSNVTA
jgi:hypothetical protein